MSTHIPVFLSSDDNFSPYVAVTIASMCYMTKSHIDFYVLHNEISPFHQNQISLLKKNFKNFDLHFLKIDTGEHFAKLPVSKWITKDAYSRVLIPELVKDIKKAIYSDVDVIGLGDIRELYEENLGAYSVGAVPHGFFLEQGSQQSFLCNKLNIDLEHKYFYSGMLLMDCNKWRQEHVTEKLLDMAEKYFHQLTYSDQCLLNKFFNNNYQQLDYKFNYTTQDYLYFKKNDEKKCHIISNSTVIRHFETPFKPWVTDNYKTGEQLPHFDDFWFFAEMTPFYSSIKQHFLLSSMQRISREVAKETIDSTLLGKVKKTIKQSPARRKLSDLIKEFKNKKAI